MGPNLPPFNRHAGVGAAVLLLLLASVAPANAQFLRVGLGAGPSSPMGGYAEEALDGMHLQGMVGLRVPLIPVSIRGDLLYQRFPLQAGGDQQQVAAVLNGFLTVLPLPIITPYLTGGVGVYHTGRSGRPLSAGTTMASAMNVGAGVRLGLHVAEVFVEARYHNPLAERDVPRAIPITAGIMF